nr:glycosyltransferase [Bacteroidota bacterium]
MKPPKISVIIPTYNAAATLGNALKSIVDQRYTNTEIVIVDACSTDKTLQIIGNYQKEHNNIICISEKDRGIYDAMNKGIDHSSGGWLYFMGADDVFYDQDVLSDLWEKGAFGQEKVFYGNVYVKGDTSWAKDKTSYDGYFDLRKLLSRNICQQALFYPGQIIEKAGYFKQEYEVSSDWDYNLRCFALQEFLHIDRIISVFAAGGKSSQYDEDISVIERTQNVFKYFQQDISDNKHSEPGSPFYKLFLDYRSTLNTRLNPNSTRIKQCISLCTAIMNRKEIFEDALKTWVNHKEVDEIIIVDWSSDESLIPLVRKYQNGKIFLAIVKNQEKWVLSYAFNLAARLTTRDKILKIDADVKILPGFFEKHTLEDGMFYTGNWEIARNENERHLNGVVFCSRTDFFKIHGYNEFITSYGWDDSDLYNRMEGAGLQRKNINPDHLHHIKHEMRTSFQDKTDFIRNIDDEERSLLNILINCHLCSSHMNWSAGNKFVEFAIEPEDEYIFKCKQVSPSVNIVSAELIQDCEVNAIKQRLGYLDENLFPEILNKLNRDELNEFYNLVFSRKNNESDQHIYSLVNKMSTYLEANIKNKNDEIKKLQTILEANIKNRKDETNNMQAILDSKEARINSMQAELDKVYSSYSLRIGHFAILPVKKVLSLFHKIKEGITLKD